jgi:hypothetical protein
MKMKVELDLPITANSIKLAVAHLKIQEKPVNLQMIKECLERIFKEQIQEIPIVKYNDTQTNTGNLLELHGFNFGISNLEMCNIVAVIADKYKEYEEKEVGKVNWNKLHEKL